MKKKLLSFIGSMAIVAMLLFGTYNEAQAVTCTNAGIVKTGSDFVIVKYDCEGGGSIYITYPRFQ